MKEIVKYFKVEGLDKFINLKNIYSNDDKDTDVFKHVNQNFGEPFPADLIDLYRLHKTIRDKKFFTVLEFGVGLSTLVMADALYKNKQDWDKHNKSVSIRNRFMFKLFSVDTAKKWIAHTKKQVPGYLKNHIEFKYSTVSIGKFNDQLCHYYDDLPDIIPDFIYLDGPDPKDVKGEINGLTFQCDERTVMAADLLLMESTLLPGTLVLVDGRTNNCRFLQNNFKRKWKQTWDKKNDITLFFLDEEKLGKYNLSGSDFY